jgi:prepilin-type processing-associated H-X9-DG protein
MRTILTIAIAVTVAAPATAQIGGPQRTTVLTKTEAFAVLPPRLIAAPMVSRVSPSPDGRYILVQREDLRLIGAQLNQAVQSNSQPPVEVSLVLWDNQRQESRAVWQAQSAAAQLQAVEWMGGSQMALAQVRETIPAPAGAPKMKPRERTVLLRISADSGRAVPILESGQSDSEFWQLSVSPAEPLAILKRTIMDPNERQGDAPKSVLHIVGAGGRAGAAIPLPASLENASVEWTVSGAPVIHEFRLSAERKGGSSHFHALDVRTGRLTPFKEKPPLLQGKAVPTPGHGDYPVRVRHESQALPGPAGQTIGLLWLDGDAQSRYPSTLISSDAEGGTLLPKYALVTYSSRGGLYAAPLMRMDREVFQKMLEAAERQVVMSNAKQLALAAMMYAQDYDENMPSPDGINGKLEPYTKNTSLFNGFTYTFAGGPLSGIKEPASTEIGYVIGPGGRAIMFADGHVKWKSD